jgi:hypothetical protein
MTLALKDIAFDVSIVYTLTGQPGNVHDYGTIDAYATVANVNFASRAYLQNGRMKVDIHSMSGSVTGLNYDLSAHSWVIRMADMASHAAIVAAMN